MSSKSTFSNSTAKSYALALYQLGKENDDLEKVKDGIIIDWAYGIYNPEGSGKKEIFFISFGFDENKWTEELKKDYAKYLKTSSGSEINEWF